MAKRKTKIINNSKVLIDATIETLSNSAVIASNISGLLADASDVLREKTPDLVSKWIKDAEETSDLESKLELDELKIKQLETSNKLKELEEKAKTADKTK